MKEEEQESSWALLQEQALLRRVLERERSLVSRIVKHADFLEALLSQPEPLRGLMRAPLVTDDYQFEQLLASVGGDGASLRAAANRDEARLLHLISNEEALGRLFRGQPAAAAAVAANPAFVEQVKVRKPQLYKALLEKAQERLSWDAGLAAEIRAERQSLEGFTNEGGRKAWAADPGREPGFFFFGIGSSRLPHALGGRPGLLVQPALPLVIIVCVMPDRSVINGSLPG